MRVESSLIAVMYKTLVPSSSMTLRGSGVFKSSSRNWQSQLPEHEVHLHALLAAAAPQNKFANLDWREVVARLPTGHGSGWVHRDSFVGLDQLNCRR
jgi:hypothetical protein